MLLETTTGIIEHAQTYRKLAEYVRILQAGVPTRVVSSTGMQKPIGYIDPNVVLSTGFSLVPEQMLEKMPEGLIVPLSHSEGFPTIDGIPFWERLDGEPLPFYEGFKAYRDMPYKLVKSATENTDIALPTVQERSVREVAFRMGEEASSLHALSLCWHWRERVIAFDQFRRQSIDLTRMQITEQMENIHQETARKIFEMCTKYILANEAKLTPASALKWAEQASKLERLSLGLNPDKPDGDESPRSGTVVQFTQNFNATQNNAQLAIGESKERVSEILGILHGVGALQELPVIDVEAEPAQDELEL